MANRETYPSSLYPLGGDLYADAGDVTVEVIGLQTVPLGPLVDGGVATYNEFEKTIDWEIPNGGDAIKCNGVEVSSDYLILCNTAFVINYGSDGFLGVRNNGVLVSD
jgi:hypothetical protein